MNASNTSINTLTINETEALRQLLRRSDLDEGFAFAIVDVLDAGGLLARTANECSILAQGSGPEDKGSWWPVRRQLAIYSEMVASLRAYLHVSKELQAVNDVAKQLAADAAKANENENENVLPALSVAATRAMLTAIEQYAFTPAEQRQFVVVLRDTSGRADVLTYEHVCQAVDEIMLRRRSRARWRQLKLSLAAYDLLRERTADYTALQLERLNEFLEAHIRQFNDGGCVYKSQINTLMDDYSLVSSASG